MFFVVNNKLANADYLEWISGDVHSEEFTDLDTGAVHTPSEATIYLKIKAKSLYEHFEGDDADLFLQQIDSLHSEDRNRLFSKEAQEYLGNLLVERDRKQKELDSKAVER